MNTLKAKSWKTFLRIKQPGTSDEVPPLDDAWILSRGGFLGAPIVIRTLQRQVLPEVRRLERAGKLEWYFFLIHGRAEGVPTSADDCGEYVDLHLFFKKPTKLAMPKPWEKTMVFEPGNSFGGVDEKTIIGGVDAARKMIGYQSEFVLRLIELHKIDTDPLVLFKQIRQYLHFYSNMLQVRVG